MTLRGASLVVVVTATVSVALACGSPPDCFGIHPGDRISITIVDTYAAPGDPVSYDAGHAGVCGFGFDLSQGQVLIAKDMENDLGKDGACKGAIAQYEPFGGWTWTLSGGQSTGSQFVLAGEYKATNGSCVGQAQVNLTDATGGDPFAPYVPGQPPNVYMTRSFTGCQRGCSGYFAVSLKRL